jgi:hypothetical protein
MEAMMNTTRQPNARMPMEQMFRSMPNLESESVHHSSRVVLKPEVCAPASGTLVKGFKRLLQVFNRRH